ncbi:MAG: superoxide dismutase [Saprospiraceae bacterium]|nr:superoxide dismutase [Saprospiraceae bacterium]
MVFLAINWSCQKDGFDKEALNEGNIEEVLLRSGKTFPEIITLPVDFQPEGIATGKGTDFYVSSIISGRKYKGDLRTGEGTVLVDPLVQHNAIGLSYDRRSNLLFVAGGFFGNGYAYDAESGALVAVFQFVTDANPTLVNDVIVTPKAAYFTDSFRPFLYKVPLSSSGNVPNPASFEKIELTGDFEMTNEPPPFFDIAANANGIDATPNGKNLILVNLSLGTLYKVNPLTGESKLIDLGTGNLTYGDGILLDGFKLYVVQNILNQISALQLSPNLLSAEIFAIITHDEFKIPAIIAEFGNYIYAVNARFDVAPPMAPSSEIEFDVVRIDKP